MKNIKDKKRILRVTRQKGLVTYEGTPINLSADFSAETLQDRREWQDIFKVMKGKNLQSRILYLARLSVRFEGDIKSCTDKWKLKEFSITKPSLQQMLMEFLYTGNTWEGKDLQKQTQNN